MFYIYVEVIFLTVSLCSLLINNTQYKLLLYDIVYSFNLHCECLIIECVHVDRC